MATAKTPTTAKRGRTQKQASVVDVGPAGPQPEVKDEPVPMMRLLDDEVPADFQVDDTDDYPDDDGPDVVDDIVHPEDSDQFGMPPEHGQVATLTTTDNFMGAQPTLVREVADHGVRMVEGERMYRVRTVIDIGPVYYGPDNLIELKKGKLYEVPESIHRYLREKDLLWEQQ